MGLRAGAADRVPLGAGRLGAGPVVRKELTFRELLSQYSGMKDNGDGTKVEDFQKCSADAFDNAWVMEGVKAKP